MKNEPKVNLLDVLKEVVEDKSVDDSVILDALKKALISAARKYLHIEKKINVDIDMETNEVHVFLNVEVVDDYPDYDPNMTADEVAEMDEGYMLVDEARDFNEDAQAGDSLYMELPTSSFGRQAIQTAKQLLTQHIRSAECSASWIFTAAASVRLSTVRYFVWNNVMLSWISATRLKLNSRLANRFRTNAWLRALL